VNRSLHRVSDFKNFDHRIRDMHNQNEASIFVKDDWKVRPSLTLNIGARWAYFSVPWESNGLMPLPVGGGNAMFGISGRSWDGWMRPGQRADATVLQFVGKGSPNASTPWYPDDKDLKALAVGFAWKARFGAGKTTSAADTRSRTKSTSPATISSRRSTHRAPATSPTYVPANNDPYLDLVKMKAFSFPVRTINPAALRSNPCSRAYDGPRNQQIYIPDAGNQTPYAQNLTLSVT
jgi:hypothetical protein